MLSVSQSQFSVWVLSAYWHWHRASGLFTLQAGDEIHITIPPIGTLVNMVG